MVEAARTRRRASLGAGRLLSGEGAAGSHRARPPTELQDRHRVDGPCRPDDVGDLEQIKKYNAIEIDENDRIVFFEEKPKEPKSTLTGIALYYYPPSTLPLIRQYISEGNNPDQPGRLVQWLYPRVPFYVWRVPGLWFDVGSIETLEEANRVFGALRK